MSTSVALAISVYDRFDDVRILVDIVRHHWPGRHEIYVCSSSHEARSALRDVAIDDLIATSDIPFDPGAGPDHTRVQLGLRVLDSIRRVCGRAAQSTVRWSMHVHADAYPLAFERVEGLTARMAGGGRSFAGRGFGFGFYVHDCPVGELDDMFFVYENAQARDRGLWDFNLFDFLPHKVSMHGALPLLVMGRIGFRRYLHYARQEAAVHWDGRSVARPPLNASVPMYYDPQHAFLHLHENAFPGDLGRQLKAHYLRSHGLTKGPAIEAYLARWDADSETLFLALRETEERLYAFWRTLGLESFARRTYDRQFTKMQQVINQYQAESLAKRATWVARKRASQLRARRRSGAPPSNGSAYFRPDRIWPSPLEPVYEQEVRWSPDLRSEFERVKLGPRSGMS